ncbi:LPS export ABC transporter periplasmic protein LptC [Candidatus Schneideria nysicola]|uniref:LPS export ABC transporter periplasmic protein LptC n=1 Tax=Candidatus Schneideria nysicola TaxID=1081631 RepID=UPI001CAA7381|nr:LPS export ABC transporter periplasmic protein LptC [Candidatus Schneideria nysicola]UAJ64836.1 LPS export ABC transporter periplasmic protein LptC [Candidatus Schneideria nysicola]
MYGIIESLFLYLILLISNWIWNDNINLKLDLDQSILDLPTYQGKNINILFYNPQTGNIISKIEALSAQFFLNRNTTYIISPITVLFSENNTRTWLITADQAILKDNNNLYLNGSIQFKNIIEIGIIQKLSMDNAVFNLLNKEIISENIVFLTGIGFQSIGMKLKGSLHDKTIELLEEVKTTYYK